MCRSGRVSGYDSRATLTCATRMVDRWASSTTCLTTVLDEVPGLAEQGPDVLDDFTFEEFTDSLKRFHGEIKGVLTRGRVISGIGNAYADEILFDAEVYPFKRRKALSEDELRSHLQELAAGDRGVRGRSARQDGREDRPQDP